MRYRRSVLIAVLASVLIASSLFAQTKAVGPGTPHQIGKGLDTMVLVPAGRFIRGSTAGQAQREYEESKKRFPGVKKEWFDREVPQRRVYLNAFYIDKYPVTNVLFSRFVVATSHRTDAEKGGGAGYGMAQRGNGRRSPTRAGNPRPVATAAIETASVIPWSR